MSKRDGEEDNAYTSLVYYQKRNMACFFSHLEVYEIFKRAMRRAEIPLKYSSGFNPQPRLNFISPLPVGIEGKREIFLFLSYNPNINFLKINKYLPEGIRIIDIKPKIWFKNIEIVKAVYTLQGEILDNIEKIVEEDIKLTAISHSCLEIEINASKASSHSITNIIKSLSLPQNVVVRREYLLWRPTV